MISSIFLHEITDVSLIVLSARSKDEKVESPVEEVLAVEE